MERRNVLQENSFQFALNIMDLVQQLKAKHFYELARQVWRSGTSIGANVEEAQGAQSRKDFVSKLAIARKEARETRYWLALINKKVRAVDVSSYLDQINELVALLTAIIKTTLTNL